MKTETNSNAGRGCSAATCSASDVEAIYALDDSCQQILYVRGHVDRDDLLAAAREYCPHAYISDGAFVVQQYMRHTPLRGNIVSDSKTTFQSEPGCGATPVTVLWLWLPIHAPNTEL